MIGYNPAPMNRSLGRSRQCGFTLLELIMVMVILTGVMAVVAPSLSAFFRAAGLGEEGRRLISLIEMTRREAIASGFPTQAWFDTEKGVYGMRELNGVQAQVLPVDASETAAARHVYRLPSELALELDNTSLFAPTAASIIYYPDGHLDVASLPGFYLKNKKNPDQKLQIARSVNGLRFEIRQGNEMVSLQSEAYQTPVY
jgi:prepilin-type N-terminal cleavage/methylation domain-containing protein